MSSQFKKFNELRIEEQDSIFSYFDRFWEMAEELGISGLKIDECENLLEHSLMGFLPPVECLERIKQIFPIHPEKGEFLTEEIKKKIFPNLRNELAQMYSPEKIGFIIGAREEKAEKILENKEKTKSVPASPLGDSINVKEEKPKESKESLSEEKKKIENKKPPEHTLGNYLELK